MSELLAWAIEAHGGLKRWNASSRVSAELSISGALWDLKGQSGLFSASTFVADTHLQSAVLGQIGALDRLMRFRPDQMTLEDATGQTIEVRDDPREAFVGHTAETPWDVLHAGYFTAYALWTYFTQPFLYAYPGFETVEIEPWHEDGEVWRRLKVTFPDHIASHTREQITYFGPGGLMRRHDYSVDVLGGAEGAQYISDYQDHSGIMAPHRRRVHPRGPDNRKVDEPVLVSIDIARLSFAAN